MTHLRLSTLCENTVDKYGITGEWGLSILVEYGEERVLFDTGLGDSVVNNARIMGIDLKRISKVVFSHGHGDHTGGIRSILKEIKQPVEIFAHPDIWEKKYSVRPEISGNRQNFVGIPYQKEELIHLGASFKYSKEPVRLSDHIITTGEIPLITDFERVDKNLFVKSDSGFHPDKLADDQALVVNTSKGLAVILGCSHRGIINTLIQAQKVGEEKKIRTIVGGTHLFRSSSQQLSKTIDKLMEFGVERIGVSHCTGMLTSVKLAQQFGKAFFFNNAGTVVKL